MLVKVVLSYYMEGEHSQGASNPRVSGLGVGGAWSRKGLRQGCDSVADPAVESFGWALDSAKA